MGNHTHLSLSLLMSESLFARFIYQEIDIWLQRMQRCWEGEREESESCENTLCKQSTHSCIQTKYFATATFEHVVHAASRTCTRLRVSCAFNWLHLCWKNSPETKWGVGPSHYCNLEEEEEEGERKEGRGKKSPIDGRPKEKGWTNDRNWVFCLLQKKLRKCIIQDHAPKQWFILQAQSSFFCRTNN